MQGTTIFWRFPGRLMASRAAAVIDEAADEETRGREVRRLSGEILRLEEEKRDLERRLAFVQGELEQTRAKLPRGISTS